MKLKKKQESKKLPDSLNRLVPEADRKAYTEYYYYEATSAIRKLLAKDLEQRIDAAVLSSERNDRFDLDSWAEFQASNIGYRKALRELIKLLTKE